MLGECRFGCPIGHEFGDMVLRARRGLQLDRHETFHAYLRYAPDVKQEGLNGLGITDVKAENAQVMDSVQFIRDIQKVGAAYAGQHVDLAHLQPFA